jgi:hypothetical protein
MGVDYSTTERYELNEKAIVPHQQQQQQQQQQQIQSKVVVGGEDEDEYNENKGAVIFISTRVEASRCDESTETDSISIFILVHIVRTAKITTIVIIVIVLLKVVITGRFDASFVILFCGDRRGDVRTVQFAKRRVAVQVRVPLERTLHVFFNATLPHLRCCCY